MKRLLLLSLAAAFVFTGCLADLLGRERSDSALAGRVFPEDAPPLEELPEGSLAVVEHAPTGEVPWENLEGGAWVLFNKPVVPLARLPKPAASSEAMRLQPALPGVFRWYGSRLLAFEPEGAPAPATEYTVLIDPRLKAQDGSTLAGLDAFRFRTPALRLLSLEPSGTDVEPESCRTLQLTFNYPVQLDTLRPALEVRADGRGYPFELRHPRGEGRGQEQGEEQRVLLLDMKRELPWDAEVTVRLAAGARPRPEAYGTPEEQSLGFHTLEPLRVENAELYDWLASVEASLQFNHPLAEGALDFVRVELPGYRVEENAEVTGASISLRNLPVAFESTFTVTVRAGLRDLYGQSLPADRSFTLEVGPASSYVSYRASGDLLLEKGFPPVAVVEFQNALSGAFAAGRLEHPFQPVPDVPLASYGELPRNTRVLRGVDLGPFLNAAGTGSAFARWRFNARSWWSEEIEAQTADLRLQVTDLGVSLHVAHNRLLAWVASLATGQPLAGAEVSLRSAAGDAGERIRQTTDNRGLASFALEAGELASLLGPRREDLELEVRLGEDRLVYRPAGSPSYTWNLRSATEAAQPVPVTWLASDRGLYRPGESLSFLGIDRDLVLGRLQARRGDWKVELWQGWSGENVVARAAGKLSANRTLLGQPGAAGRPGAGRLPAGLPAGRQRAPPGDAGEDRLFPPGGLRPGAGPARRAQVHGRQPGGPLRRKIPGGGQPEPRPLELVVGPPGDSLPPAGSGRAVPGLPLRRPQRRGGVLRPVLRGVLRGLLRGPGQGRGQPGRGRDRDGPAEAGRRPARAGLPLRAQRHGPGRGPPGRFQVRGPAGVHLGAADRGPPVLRAGQGGCAVLRHRRHPLLRGFHRPGPAGGGVFRSPGAQRAPAAGELEDGPGEGRRRTPGHALGAGGNRGEELHRRPARPAGRARPAAGLAGADHRGGRALLPGAFRKGPAGAGGADPAGVLLHGQRQRAVAALGREAHRAGARSPRLRPGRQGPPAGQEPAGAGTLPADRGARGPPGAAGHRASGQHRHGGGGDPRRARAGGLREPLGRERAHRPAAGFPRPARPGQAAGLLRVAGPGRGSGPPAHRAGAGRRRGQLPAGGGGRRDHPGALAGKAPGRRRGGAGGRGPRGAGPHRLPPPGPPGGVLPARAVSGPRASRRFPRPADGPRGVEGARPARRGQGGRGGGRRRRLPGAPRFPRPGRLPARAAYRTRRHRDRPLPPAGFADHLPDHRRGGVRGPFRPGGGGAARGQSAERARGPAAPAARRGRGHRRGGGHESAGQGGGAGRARRERPAGNPRQAGEEAHPAGRGNPGAGLPLVGPPRRGRPPCASGWRAPCCRKPWRPPWKCRPAGCGRR